MSLARIRPALLAVLAALLLAAGLAPVQANASEDSGEASEAGTITTLLHPGWNMVGWVGPATPTHELFEALPELRRVSTWDAGEGAYRRASRGRYDELPSLTPGMGLWLYIGGDGEVQWARLARPDGFVIRLAPGANMVAIAADGGVTSVGLVATAAWRWDSATQRFKRYTYGDDTLRAGDALLVSVREAVNWWQPGTRDTALVFVGDVPAETRASILEHYERVKEFFVSRFGIVTPGPLQYIGPDAEALQSVYSPELDFEFGLHEAGCRSGVSGRLFTRILACTYPNVSLGRHLSGPEFSLVPEFTRNLIHHVPNEWRWLGALPTPARPHWLTAGGDLYPQTAYAEADDPSDRWRAESRVAARRVPIPLSDLEEVDTPGVVVALSYDERALSFFAIEHLIEFAGEPALFEYFRRLRTAGDWRDTFEAVFGVSVEDHYASFESHRAEAFPPLPHLADDLNEPILVVLDGVPAETGAAIREEFDTVRRFFATRFEAEATEFSIYVAPDAETLVTNVVRPDAPTVCSLRPSWGVVALPLDLCADAPIGLASMYYSGVRSELEHDPSLPSRATWIPRWLRVGSELYVLAAYADHREREPYVDYRNFAVASVARHTPGPLEQITSFPDGIEFPGPALAFLAVEWLANHAGDPAVFEYYRVLPSAPSREAAFEQAFGLTIEDFYEQFEAYRASLVTR